MRRSVSSNSRRMARLVLVGLGARRLQSGHDARHEQHHGDVDDEGHPVLGRPHRQGVVGRDEDQVVDEEAGDHGRTTPAVNPPTTTPITTGTTRTRAVVAMLRWLRSGSHDRRQDGHGDESGDRSHHRRVAVFPWVSTFVSLGLPRYRRPDCSRAPGHRAQWGPWPSPGTTEHREPVESDAVGPTGRFRIYMGAVAGVGKTFAMLDEGWRRHRRGADVVVGFVETHGRPRTAELIRDLEVVPRKVVAYRGSQFEEMDVDAVLARRPEVALVDELAHTNVPGVGTQREALAGRHRAHRRRDRGDHHGERPAPREHRRRRRAHDRHPGA